jgi:hypothetical protein
MMSKANVIFSLKYIEITLELRFSNRREKIYRNVIFSLKYIVHPIF